MIRLGIAPRAAGAIAFVLRPASAAAMLAGALLVQCLQGLPSRSIDALIAAIALGAEATVATRDTGGFSDCGLALINPWTTGE